MVQKVDGATALRLHGTPAFVVASHLGRVSVESGATWANEETAANRKTMKIVVCFMMMEKF